MYYYLTCLKIGIWNFKPTIIAVRSHHWLLTICWPLFDRFCWQTIVKLITACYTYKSNNDNKGCVQVWNFRRQSESDDLITEIEEDAHSVVSFINTIRELQDSFDTGDFAQYLQNSNHANEQLFRFTNPFISNDNYYGTEK